MTATTVSSGPVTLWGRLVLAFRGGAPKSLFDILRERKPRLAATKSLYVLRVDFQVSAEVSKKIDESLDPIRRKYGLDFLVLEPGISLKRFDEF